MSRRPQLCPLCHASRFNLSVHLRDFHKVDSKTERRLLNSMSSGRFAGRINCPVANCPAASLSRVDRHLRLYHQLHGDELKWQITAAKKNAARQSLQEFKSQHKAKQDQMKDLEQRVAYLEERLAHLPHLHPSSAVSQGSHKLLFSDLVLAKYRESVFRIGASSKCKQNQKRDLAHIKHFVDFMWDNPQSPAAAHLKYLLDMSKVNTWLSNLNKKFNVGTIKNFILPVTKFCRFLLDARLSCVRLEQRQINSLLQHFKCQLKILSKRVIVHRRPVRCRKMRRMAIIRRRRTAAVFLSSEEEEGETQKGHSSEGMSGAFSDCGTGESQASVGETSGVQVLPQAPVTEAGSAVMAGELEADEGKEFTEEAEFKLYLDDEEEEEQVEERVKQEEEQECELPSPLSKSVPRFQTPLLRRKLTYHDTFKDMMKAKFQPYWGSPIKTGVIHRVLAESPSLLQTCKDMSLTIDNVRGLLKQLQRE